MANNVRSEYLQSLIEEKNNLNEKMKEIAKSTINNIMGENIEKTIRHMISEAEDDSFIEDEVEDVKSEDDTDETVVDAETAETDVESTDDNSEGDEVTDVESTEADVEFDDDTTGEGDEDIWNDLEAYKMENGEFDLTGMGNEQLLKVMMAAKPEDGVRVVKNDDNTITLTDDSTEKEYIITVDCADGECETDELTTEGKLGYGVRQKETAMTTPPNKETAPNGARTWDDVPTGTERRFGNGSGDGDPYDNSVNEEEEAIIEVVEGNEEQPVDEHAGQGGQAVRRGDSKTPGDGSFGPARNNTPSGHGTGEAPYSNAQLESIKKKANELWKENKELKDVIVPALRKQIMENILINKSMSKVVKLVMENTTSLNEKKDIVRRFQNVKNEQECDTLYETISRELKQAGKTVNMNEMLNSQLSESKVHSTTEEPMFQSEELSDVLDLIKRMSKIK